MVAVWFLWDGEKFLIFSQPNTQKLRNLRHNSHVTLALDDTHSGGDVLVIDGEAELLTDPDVNARSGEERDRRQGLAQQGGGIGAHRH